MYKLSSSNSQSPSRYKKKQNTHRPQRAQNTQKKPSVILSAIFGICAILGICLFTVLLVLRSFGVGHVIRNTDILGILEDFSTGEHAYYIIDQVNGLPFSETEVTLYDIEEFIKREHVTDELERLVGGYATALMFGNLSHHVTVDDIIIAARNIEPELHDFFDHRMTDDDFYRLAQTLDDILDFDSLSLEGIIMDLDMEMSPLPLILLSPVFLWVVGLLSAGFLLVLFLQRKSNIAAAFLSIGIPVTLSGAISFGTATYIVTQLGVEESTLARFSRFLEEPVQLLSQLGLIVAAVGMAVMIISLVVRLARQGDV